MNWFVSYARRLLRALIAPMDESRLDQLRDAALQAGHPHVHPTSLWFQLRR